ncbi:ABC transporter ATP-binding protein [Bacillus alkalicellulosilyticus]|uniref:ABC transporter ATP-binding protein n=1 Tax=Alkalihalobacterium alkalicellulosilyticum TaxID=1912214 RepID=UPI0014823FA1|nr:ABC transporter ATP-binding protein [Bacillus alkalicellulosilyticus]
MSLRKERKKNFTVYLWVLSFIKPYKWQALLLIGCFILASSIELLIPKVIQVFIDNVIPNADTRLFYSILVGLGILIIIMIGLNGLANLLRRNIQEKAAKDLQFTMFQHLRSLGFSYFEKHPVGQSLALINSEVENLQRLYRHHFPAMIGLSVFSIISLLLMVSTSLHLTLITIPCFFLYYLVGPYLERRSAIWAKRTADSRVDFNNKAYESISALVELRANGAEEKDLQQFMTKKKTINSGLLSLYWFGYWRESVRRFSYYVGAMVIFGYGYWLIQNNLLSVGEIVAFILYYFVAMQRLTYVITLVTEQQVLMQQASILYDFHQLKPEVEERKNIKKIKQVTGEIKFDSVHFSYNENSPNILNGFNLHIKPGETVALVGTSGMGKTTILKLLGRFYDVTKGQIQIDGCPLQDIPFSHLRESLGYVFQETFLFGDTIYENIKFGKPDADETEVYAAAKAAYADEFIDELPDGYQTVLGERGINLSGGQKQRIALARMFLKDPKIVLLDEATSSLDTISETHVQRALSHLAKGRTTVIVAHRISTIQHADKIVVVDHGRVVEMGTYQELMNLKGHFYHMSEANSIVS